MKKTLAQTSSIKSKPQNLGLRMHLTKIRFPNRNWILVFTLVLFLSLILNSSGSAQNVEPPIYLIRDLEIDELGIQNPAGLVYSQLTNAFFVLETNTYPFQSLSFSDFISINTSKEKLGFTRIYESIDNANNLAFDNRFNRLLILQPATNQVIQVNATRGGKLDSNSLKRTTIPGVALQDPQGITINPSTGGVFILDNAVNQIIQIQPAEDGSLNGASTSKINLAIPGSVQVQGLAYDPTSNHFHVMDRTGGFLLEISSAGQIISKRELSALELSDLRAMVIAPSSDPTDGSETMSLFLIDSAPPVSQFDPTSDLFKAESELQAMQTDQSVGRILELSMDPLPLSSASIPIDFVTLVNTTDTSVFSPPSPDPSGLALFVSNKLIISDGEVEEITPPNPATYTGYNLFITTLGGTLDSTLTTENPPDVNFSDEPTGVAFNPANGFLYFSDDTGTQGVYELNPGPDTFYNTSDDVITFYTNVGGDPEGIAFDGSRTNNHLIVIDGMSREIYDIDLGANGVLDTTDSVTNFDVGPASEINLNDPEGVEVNPVNDHLYIMDSSGQKRIAETLIDGTLIRYLDLTAVSAHSPAGLAYAPASDGLGGSHLYIVDRGVDNGADPNENDGKMYEVSFPLDVNYPPQVNAGSDMLATINVPTNLDGTVSDDGKPDPPGVVTTLWSVVSQPQAGADVVFVDPNAVDTTATFPVPGDYVLRLTADDSLQTNFDEVMITAQLAPINQPPTVSAGSGSIITLPADAILNGTVSDDGLPDPPGAYTMLWTKTSGPGVVTFADDSLEDTTASFSAPGQYTLRLTADDGALSAYDEIPIVVNSALNQAPIVDAGSPQTITFPSFAVLDGTVTDDGLPDPPGSYTTLWSVISGPGLVTFTDANAIDTSVLFATDGQYILLLTADDNDLIGSDQVTITVSPATVQNIWLPIVLSKTTNR